MAQIETPIEVDVTYVNQQWIVRDRWKIEKHYVIGFFKRVEHKARIISLKNNKPETIHQAIIEVIELGVELYCEETVLPISLKDLYDIKELKPSDGYANGELHINNVKSGNYIPVRPNKKGGLF